MHEEQESHKATEAASGLNDGLGALLPCPFCGGDAEINKHFREDMWSLLHRCRVMGPISIDWTSRESIWKRWNHRA
jgi:hypothetical protein